MVFNMIGRLRVTAFLLVMACELHAHESLQAYISFEEKKIWFFSTSERPLFVSVDGSTLNLDDNFGEDGMLNLIPRKTAGFVWFMRVSRNEVHVNNGLNITNFKRIKLAMREAAVAIRIPLFVVDKNGKMTGPHTPLGVVKLMPLPKGKINRDRMIFMPVPLEKFQGEGADREK